MTERYTRVFAQQGRFYCSGAPVVIEARALLKDNQNGRIVAQIKFKSISPKAIRALTVKIHAKDVSGEDVEGVDSFQYLDLKVQRNEEFGTQTPITLPNAVTRSFSCECLSAVFIDGSSWTCAEDATWETLSAPTLLKNAIGADLANQYKRETNAKAEYKVTDHGDLWYCSCGTLNKANETYCQSCHAEKAALLAALNTDVLSANKKKYEDAVAEAEKLRSAKAKKTRIILASAVTLLIALVLIITKVIIPANNYKNATALLNGGEYAKAEEAFIALKDYKDAQTMVLECRYQYALQLLRNGEHDSAYKVLKNLGDYPDAAESILRGKQQQLEDFLTAHAFDEAQMLATELESYAPTQEFLLQAVLRAINEGNDELAIQTATLLFADGSHNQQAQEALYIHADSYFAAKDFDHSNPIFAYLDTYKDSALKIHEHDLVSEIVAVATCEAEGKVIKTCTCGLAKEIIVPATGHNYLAATCTQPKICSTCQKKDGQALGHTTSTGVCQRCKTDFSIPTLTQDALQGTWMQSWYADNATAMSSRTYTFTGNTFTYVEKFEGKLSCQASGTFTVSNNTIYITGTFHSFSWNGEERIVNSSGSHEVDAMTDSYIDLGYASYFYKQ